ncbi:rhomboid family intramembrane serine protease [Bacteroidia bacterium]|nr:rhomboid family intramembrane serine protease [Bacteroidia bacterium]
MIGFNNISPIIKRLIIINVVMLVLTMLTEHAGIDLVQWFGLYYFKSQYFQPYQFVTHIFMHGGWMHLLFNMYALYIFGTALEQVWGGKRLLIYYFTTGLGAATLHTFVNYLEISHLEEAVSAFINTPTPELLTSLVKTLKYPAPWLYEFIDHWGDAPFDAQYVQRAAEIAQAIVQQRMDVPTVGASGAVYGVLLAFGMLFPNTRLMLLFPPIPIKAKWFVVAYGAIELALGISDSGSNVAHFAHVGGMLFGLLLILYWRKNSRDFY